MSSPRKVAIVTGASRGIGAGLVAALRGDGYAVVATARSVADSDAADLLTVRGDITDPETAELVVQQALARFGQIDSLINNAGLFVSKPFTDYTVDDYASVTGVNLLGFLHITQRVIGPMVAQGSGHIVNITTSLVDHALSASPSALASLTKGGLAAATRSLATEYAGRGVRVNAIAPGIVASSLDDPGSYEALAGLHPLGRTASIEDIVDAVRYLERATFVTGETLHVDGGMAAGH